MYRPGTQISDLNLCQQQQLQLLQLADVYDVPAVSHAVLKSICSLQINQLHWDTATAILTLPDSCKELNGYNILQKAAANKLQEQLGDLEVLWAPAGPDVLTPSQLQLLQLPFPALQLLLSDPRTKVSSEDTIFYTMNRWLQYNTGTSQEQQQKLAQLLRLPYCTPSYLTSVICAPGSWVLNCFSPSDLISVAAVCAGTSSHKVWASGLIDGCATSQSCGQSFAWGLPPRETSSMCTLALEVKVPMSEVIEHYDRAMAGRDFKKCFHGKSVRWQGRELALSFTLKRGCEKATLHMPEQRFVGFGTHLVWQGVGPSPVTFLAGEVLWSGPEHVEKKMFEFESTGFKRGMRLCQLETDWGGNRLGWSGGERAQTSEDMVEQLETEGLLHEGEGGGYLCFKLVITAFR
jgi:hypothetical protein